MSTPELASRTGIPWRASGRSASEIGWRLLAAGPMIAAFTMAAALIATGAAGVAFRDPDHVAALYILEVGAGIALLVGLDIFLRARKLTGERWPSRAAMGAVRRERWTRTRVGGVAVGVVSFYVTYLAYRNLKAVVPLLRPDDLFDIQLLDIDKAMFLGNDPAVLLHDLLGTGISAHILSTFYAAFIVFLPLSLALFLVYSAKIQTGLFYASAISINWILGAASYFLLPALGPIYIFPDTFSALPHTEVTNLQEMLMDDRVGFLADPATGTPQAIAAFASLHIAMSFTALLASYWLGLGKGLKRALWVWLGLTFVATVYLGWHYFVDDLAGLVIGAAALYLAILVTGYDPRRERDAAAATP